jgi:hypothetical protein
MLFCLELPLGYTKFFRKLGRTLSMEEICAIGFVCRLPGGSQPILVQGSDGNLYVAKFAGHMQDSALPLRESMGSELYSACGLMTPAWKPLRITESFLEQNPECWPQTVAGRVRPASGLWFASQFLGGQGKRLLEVLPGSSFLRVRNRLNFWLAWLVDVCAMHADNRQAIFIEQPSRCWQAVFIDHGHLFGGPEEREKPRPAASRYLDPRIYPALSVCEITLLREMVSSVQVDKLWRKLKTLPEEWMSTSTLYRFGQCLHHLSSYPHVTNVLEEITRIVHPGINGTLLPDPLPFPLPVPVPEASLALGPVL